MYWYIVNNTFNISKVGEFCVISLLRYETKEHIISLRNTLGSCISYGLRAKKPNLYSKLVLRKNMKLNVIYSNNEVEYLFKKHTNK